MRRSNASPRTWSKARPLASPKRDHSVNPPKDGFGSRTGGAAVLWQHKPEVARDTSRVHGSLLPSQGNAGRAPTCLISVSSHQLEHAKLSHDPDKTFGPSW